MRSPDWVPWRAFTIDTSWDVLATEAALTAKPGFLRVMRKDHEFSNAFECRAKRRVFRFVAKTKTVYHQPPASAFVRVKVDCGSHDGVRLHVSISWPLYNAMFAATWCAVTATMCVLEVVEIIHGGFSFVDFFFLALFGFSARLIVRDLTRRFAAEASRAEASLRAMCPGKNPV